MCTRKVSLIWEDNLVDIQKIQCKKAEYIKMKRVEKFILHVGEYEEKIFTKRSIIREKKLRCICSERADISGDGEIEEEYVKTSSKMASSEAVTNTDQVLSNTKELKQKLKDYLRSQADSFSNTSLLTDKVKFGLNGWRSRYYKEKFSAETSADVETIRKASVTSYGGLCWVLQYYFSGVPSWNWFYPYHYGPLASDLKGLSSVKAKFEKGLPFKPFDQLMAVLPPRSVHALPLPYKRLMTDTMSNIIEFYPTDYETDVDGKRFLWQGVCKLPFIDERRLLKETREIEIELKKDRNSSSSNRLFARKSTCQGQEIISTCRRACAGLKDDDDDSTSLELSMDGIRGRIRLMSLEQPNLGDDCVGESAEDVICVFLKTDENLEHIPRILEGVKFPIEIVSDGDIMETKLWHEHHGGSSSSSGNYRNRFQNVVRQKQPTTSRKANISSHTFVDEGAGTGFGMGRGKQSMPAPAAEHCNNLHKSVAPFRAARDLSSRTHAGRGQWSSSSNYGGSASDRSAYEDTGGRKQCERFEGLTVSNSRNSCSYHRNFRQSESWTSNKQTTVAAWRRRGSSNFPGQNQSTSTEAHYGYGRGRGWDSSRT